MSTFILILTMVALDYRSAPAIHTVPGFASMGDCTRAGNAWLLNVNPDASRHFNPKIVCVEQKAQP